ncbi:uncharacterized protein N0V89_010074 [Didymosphaeria variabile]|uniref:Inhibitor of growth protein N-terminal histone-binding domain-containing protein n=1 Tax=Didymosphaeria variabile TaxID=1932322 RepID=A0A9W8XGB4_9PLEO|nr:uncharacterized protein N0V89_010074 [Didymosphaeria variabile]KAJ4348696.1 hypothetical protein N0V89_010074 [Didymosphaeria variabile]
MAEDAAAQEEATPPPVANPDAQTTVNDFLDYTEFFPSDLVRSLRLIGDLDQTYVDATQTVHQLTVKYGKLPTIPAGERPDPVALRKEIALALDKAIYARESSYAEASRLYEVAERHKHRIGIIKRKLQAQPEPPSRDPTPVPVSPQALRGVNRNFTTPHLRLTFDGRFGGSSTARPRDRKKSRVPLPGARIRTASFSDSDDSEVRFNADLAIAPKRLKDYKDKAPRPPKVRVRPPGSGTNVHSSFAGISTSNALARLSPPPENARPGSKWAPWFKLTEYEMAVLRKKMKKNAVWTPSETMIKRQLEAGGRGQEAYEKERKRCEETGDAFLDEEPAAPTIRSIVPPGIAENPPAPSQPAAAPTDRKPADIERTPIELYKYADFDDADASKDTSDFRDTRQSKRDSRRRQAFRDAQELENTTKRIKEAADWMQELSFTGAGSRKSAAKLSNKRKRDSTPPPAGETPAEATREPSLVSQDSGTKPPERKKPRLNLTLTNGGASTPQDLTPIGLSPGVNTAMPFPEASKTTTVQVPLAPAGPGTPKSPGISQLAVGSQPGTPAVTSPAVPVSTEAQAASAGLPQTNVTAASSRPRRESVAPPKEKPTSPAPATAPTEKKLKVPTSAPEAVAPTSVQATRPRSSRPSSSRGHVPTPKAQSEEPKPYEQGQSSRELRRHSIFSQSAVTAPATAAPTRTRTRRKAPPKGEISHGEDGQMTVTNVKRAQGNKIAKKKKPEEESEPAEEIDQDEERYCICDGISEGRNLPPDVEALFTKQPPIKDVIEFAMGENGTYFVSYRDHDGEVVCRHYNLPNPLTEYLYCGHPRVIRDLTTLSISIGPWDSYYAHDKTSASWSNLPPSLEKALLHRLVSQDAWKTIWKEEGRDAPSFVSLGADGSYFMRTVKGGGSWDLKGKEKEEGLRGTNDFLDKAPDFSAVAGLYLFPQHQSSYILLLTSGKAFSNLPEHTWEDYNKMAPALPPLIQTLSPIPCVPQARPTSQTQIPQPQPQPQIQMQPQQGNGWVPNPYAGQPAGTYFRGHLIQRAGAGPMLPPQIWHYTTGHATPWAMMSAPYGGTDLNNSNSSQVGIYGSSDASGGGFGSSDFAGGGFSNFDSTSGGFSSSTSGGDSGGGGSTSTS